MKRPHLEAALCGLFVVLAVLTAAWPTWIESLGIEPDGGDGGAEWLLVIVLGAAAGGLGLLARHDYAVARSRSPLPASDTSAP